VVRHPSLHRTLGAVFNHSLSLTVSCSCAGLVEPTRDIPFQGSAARWICFELVPWTPTVQKYTHFVWSRYAMARCSLNFGYCTHVCIMVFYRLPSHQPWESGPHWRPDDSQVLYPSGRSRFPVQAGAIAASCRAARMRSETVELNFLSHAL
jgi:hypothetical protein